MPAPKKHPEKKIGPFPNGIGVAIWINEVQTENGSRAFRSVTLAPRRYFDRETNQWKDAPSYQPGDLPSLIHALELALDHCDRVPIPGHEADSGAEPGTNGGASEAAAAGPGGEVPF